MLNIQGHLNNFCQHQCSKLVGAPISKLLGESLISIPGINVQITQVHIQTLGH